MTRRILSAALGLAGGIFTTKTKDTKYDTATAG